MNTTKLEIVNPKYYQRVFDISYNTAIAWYNDDLEMIGRNRMTKYHFELIYEGIEPLNVPDVYLPKGISKNTKKHQINTNYNQKTTKPKKGKIESSHLCFHK